MTIKGLRYVCGVLAGAFLLLAILGQQFPGTIFEATIGPTFAVLSLLTVLAYFPARWFLARSIPDERPAATSSSGAKVPVNASTEELLSRLTIRPTGRIAMIALVVLAVGVAQGVGYGWSNTVMILVGGSAGTIGGLFGSRGSIWGAVLPYLFGAYLVLVEGAWGVWQLFVADFSWPQLLASAGFLYLGYRMVYWAYVLTELHTASDEQALAALGRGHGLWIPEIGSVEGGS